MKGEGIMKKIFALVLTLMMIVSLSTVSFAGDISGWWEADGIGTYVYIDQQDGTMQILFPYGDSFDVKEFSCAITEENGVFTLIPFTFDTELRFVQRFADRDGWMDLTDANGNTTSWLMVTPADVADAGLEANGNNPLVGVWSMMSDDLSAPCADFYDDGYFTFEDLMGLGDSDSIFAQPLFGRYQLENGLLSLYSVDSNLTITFSINDDNTLNGASMDEDAEYSEDVHFVPLTTSSVVPTAETILGTWENDESTITFHADGTIDMAGIADYGTWSLNGCRLIISSDDPVWSFASYVFFADEDPSRLLISHTDGSLSSEYTKK